MITKWKVKIPDYFGKWWNEFDTYSDEERARKDFNREDDAKLIKITEELVEQKGQLPTDKNNE